MALLSGKLYDEEKRRLYELQAGICPICGRQLPAWNECHLDHDHALDGPTAGRVRGLLCNLCNGTEGRMKHFYERSGLVSRDVEYLSWLRSLLTYLERDHSGANIHPKYLTDLKARFKRKNRDEMMEELVYYSIPFSDNMTKAELCKAFNKGIKKAILKQ